MDEPGLFRPEAQDINLLKQGAEAKIYACTYQGRPTIIKQRFKKTYRHPALDWTLTVRRVRAESKSIQRCRNKGNYVDQFWSSVAGGCKYWLLLELQLSNLTVIVN